MRFSCRGAAALSAVATCLLGACSATAPNAGAALPPVTPIMVPPTIGARDEGTLVGQAWGWTETRFADDKRVTSGAPERYTLEFFGDGRLQLRADCNRGGARYAAGPGRALTLAPAAVTKMGCPRDSKDSEFLRELAQVSAYQFADGDLVLTLGTENGAMRFSPLAR